MGLEGMDVASAQATVGMMRAFGDRVPSLVNQLTTQLTDARWLGSDRDAFMGSWESVVQDAAGVGALLEQLAGELTDAIRRQEQASST